MDVLKEEPRHSIEPLFLAQAQSGNVKLRIGQMNRTEHEGTIRDIGRYEVNIDENGTTVTLLKQEIAFFTAQQPVLQITADTDREPASPDDPSGKPNIQHEFLDKALREKQTVTIFLINGQRFRASITGYDNFTILFKEGTRQHLFYKHAITTINR